MNGKENHKEPLNKNCKIYSTILLMSTENKIAMFNKAYA